MDQRRKIVNNETRDELHKVDLLIHQFIKQSPQDWPEDFSHENGNYVCTCVHCGRLFYGHKRRVTCRVCSSSDI